MAQETVTQKIDELQQAPTRIEQIAGDFENVLLYAGKKTFEFHQLMGALGEHGDFTVNVKVTLVPTVKKGMADDS